MRTEVSKAHAMAKMLETGQVDAADTSWIYEELSLDERNDGCFNKLNDDRNGVEWREDCDQTHTSHL